MSRAIDDLVHEHDAILHALKILGGMVRQIEGGHPARGDDLRAFIGFLKEFADKCHHGKEEGLLFPALVAAGIAQEGGPVGAMLQEHAEGRAWIRQMEGSLAPALDASAFTDAARGYSALLQAHIRKENEILFPMAERALTPAQLDGLYAAFEAHEAQVIGAGRHEQLHALLKTLGGRYLATA